MKGMDTKAKGVAFEVGGQRLYNLDGKRSHALGGVEGKCRLLECLGLVWEWWRCLGCLKA